MLRERLEGPGNAGSLLKCPRLRQSFRQQQDLAMSVDIAASAASRAK